MIGPSPAELEHLERAWAEALRLTSAARRRALLWVPPLKIRKPTIGAARFHEKSANRKLGPVDLVQFPGQPRPRPIPRPPYVSSTYASIEATCPDSCAFKRSGCFADSGFTKMASQLMDGNARGRTPLQVIAEEALAIRTAFGGRRIPQDGARGGRDLRLHVGGDVASIAGAILLGNAARDWRRRAGGAVWGFTHWWREIPRGTWGPYVSVLASVEHPRDFAAARAQGYAPAIVVERFQTKNGRSWDENGTKVIPCPAETRGSTCAQCRLCLDRPLFPMNAAIAFAVHGTGAAAATEKLHQIRRDQ